MTFSEYQRKSKVTAIYPEIGHNFVYPTLGLCGEAGEVAEIVKKIIRDKGGMAYFDSIQDIKKELGDVLWYLAQVASEFGMNLDVIAETNLEKLQSRKDRGVLNGEGDNR